MKKQLLSVVLVLLLGGLLIAHPHFSKTVTADLDGRVLKLHYTTYPYSESHLAEVTPGFVFHCGRATLNIEGAVGSAGQPIPPGEYLVRAIAKSVDDWNLVLVPASTAPTSSPIAVAQGITLPTTTTTGLPVSHHLDLDLYSGHDATDGKLIVSVSFGERRVEGVLDLL